MSGTNIVTGFHIFILSQNLNDKLYNFSGFLIFNRKILRGVSLSYYIKIYVSGIQLVVSKTKIAFF